MHSGEEVSCRFSRRRYTKKKRVEGFSIYMRSDDHTRHEVEDRQAVESSGVKSRA